ncbi:MAG TPA: acyl-CoA dehydratase activase-related protein [Patescibacteria group bacterium]|nr:acyl-CoA dehydratase activase-related protein [Patescibacteria group bacterium]
MDQSLRVGVDVGSTTIKLVVLDSQDNIIFRQYLRHFSDVKSTLREMLGKARCVLQEKWLSVMVTGSAGIGVSQYLELPFVQEVISCTCAVRRMIPQTDTVIELGGEDAKITYLDGTVEQRMNGVCAGGTGAFIDHMAALLNTDAAGLNELAKGWKTVYPIASRCGVFAKTDVQSLLNEGVPREDICASILQAIVTQTISGLAQGRPIRGRVAFLGGPLHFLSELRRRFVETLGLSAEQVIELENSPYFVAIGAALSLKEAPVQFWRLQQKYSQALNRPRLADHTALPLFADESEYMTFAARHRQHTVPCRSLETYAGPAFLGIDAGSTTTKLALVDADGALLYSFYGSNQGQPLDAVMDALRQLYGQLNEQTRIAYSLVTGYGERLIQTALRVDAGEVETAVHLKAASAFQPGVTFVLDIGGQDIKCFFVRDGVIDSIMLNEACSSGCGSFIENFAQSVGVPVQEFAALALQAAQPVDLGTRCTVFMNSKVKEAQKEGATLGDIAAGVAISVVKNALFKVIRLKDVALLGDQIVVQGGTFCNDAVLRALEIQLGREVVRPDIAGIMGAYGAALLAREQGKDSNGSTLLSASELAEFREENRTQRCQGCGNQCLMTVKRFADGREYFAGNRCERGTGHEKAMAELPNLYAYKYQRVFAYAPLPETVARRGTLGIPRVMNLYEDYPFWFTLFTQLGYRVILSGRSSRALYEQGMETIPSETVCYPAKLVHGHIADLVRRGVRKIFYPCLTRREREDPTADNGYHCPVVASYAEVIRVNMDQLAENNVVFYQPFLPLDNRKRLLDRLMTELAPENIPRREWAQALGRAYAEMESYRADIRQQGEAALAYMTREGCPGILLAGRPYHTDPELHHGLPELLQSYGFVVLSEDSVRHLVPVERPLRVVDQWLYHSRLYAAATLVSRRPDLELIQLNSFGCGLDAVVGDQVRELLERHDKIYTLVKLDEVNNLGAVRIRVRSLLAARRERLQRQKPTTPLPLWKRVVFTSQMRRDYTILAPQLSPVHLQFVEMAFQRAGYNMVVPDLPDRLAVEEGLKYVHNDVCYPAVLVVGQLLQALNSGRYPPDRVAVAMVQTGGGCRASNYIALLRKALMDAGWSQVPVFSLWGEPTPGYRLTLPLFKDIVQGVVYGDALQRGVHRVRPYERQTGAANAMYAQWSVHCRQALRRGAGGFGANIQGIIRDFDSLEINETQIKPRVGVVGEILVKYHPFANNRLVELLENEGTEVVVPDLLDFFLYSAYDRQVEYDLLDGGWTAAIKGRLFRAVLEHYRRDLRQALQRSRRFYPPPFIEDRVRLSRRHVSPANMTGEGWLLTGEMLEMIREGVPNILCLQPFGCLPNHITGKGMLKELRYWYPQVNILPIDYDPGASEINQMNRIKLLLAVARERANEN